MKPDLANLTSVQDPFNTNSLDRVSIVGWVSGFDHQWHYTGSVEFKNGLTKAQQRFEGATFEEVAKKIEAFGKEIETR